MLIELDIRDFAIVDHLRLSLEAGLNALTGETGAGKSILIDALGAVLGQRTSPSSVRTGADRAVVEATFQRPPDLPIELEVEPDDDVLILSREIGANGRGAARLNGRSVPLSVLQLAGRALVDIHGQSDHQSLLRPATHLDFLDRFAGLQPQRQRMATLVQELRGVRQELAQLEVDTRERAREQDLLRYQIEEIDSIAPVAGEDDDIAQRRAVLANAEKLRDLASTALARLNDEGQAIDALLAASKSASDAARVDENISGAVSQLDDAAATAQEAARELRRYLDGIEPDPEELKRLDDRLDALRGLKRKYGETLAEVLAFATGARRQLASIEGAGEHANQLRGLESDLVTKAGAVAQELSAARHEAAGRLAQDVEAELRELNMAGARFSADVRGREAAEALQPSGMDDVEFFLAANPGESLRPLAQVASGGEASRLMLALKSVFSAIDETPVLVFDEIEVGVGARGGQIIGQKLRGLAEHHQVLCITHLAPVAAMAAAHFKVAKAAQGERTTTTVTQLQSEDRVDELAEMLAGRPITDSARQSARDLLQAACPV